MTARPPDTTPGVATAWGLTLAAALVALIAVVSAFWSHYTVVSTPDGPAVVHVQTDARKALR